MTSRRLSGVVAAVALASGLLAGCGGGGGGAGSIVLYNGQHPQTTQALVSAFERQTGISVAVRSDDEDVFANQLVAEGAHSPADVIYTENSPPLEFLSAKHLLAPLHPATLARVPARLRSAEGTWVGVSARVSVLVFNTDLVRRDQLPTSVLGLADPRWRGKLALAPSETDFQPIVTSVIDTYGVAAARRWLLGLKANAAGHTYPDNETLVSAVKRAGRPRGHQPVLLVPRAGRRRRRRDALRVAYFGPATRATSSTCRGRPCCARAPTRPTRSASWPSWSARRARPSSPTATASSTRSPRGQRPPRWGRCPSTSSDPTRSPSPTSGTGRRPWPCSNRSSCCDRHPRDRPGPHPPPGPAPAAGPAPGAPPLVVLAGAVAVVLLLPLAFLVLEAVQDGWTSLAPILFRRLTVTLLWNTISLTVVVTALSALIGTLAAWCVERTDLPGRRIWAVLVVVPVGIPDFAVAFGWKSVSPRWAGSAGRCWS